VQVERGVTLLASYLMGAAVRRGLHIQHQCILHTASMSKALTDARHSPSRGARNIRPCFLQGCMRGLDGHSDCM
jgi:hypothetical protein